uniref:Uncharacterized protein n=1 Tax=Anopheles melas TaxID=34690 RepID=A0A182TYK8_9DIPT
MVTFTPLELTPFTGGPVLLRSRFAPAVWLLVCLFLRLGQHHHKVAAQALANVHQKAGVDEQPERPILRLIVRYAQLDRTVDGDHLRPRTKLQRVVLLPPLFGDFDFPLQVRLVRDGDALAGNEHLPLAGQLVRSHRVRLVWFCRCGFLFFRRADWFHLYHVQLAQNVHDKVEHTFGPQVPDALVRDDGFALPVPGLQDLLHQVQLVLDRRQVRGELADRLLLQLDRRAEPAHIRRDDVARKVKLGIVLEEADQQLAHRADVPRFVLYLLRVAQVPGPKGDARDALLQVLHRRYDGQLTRLQVKDHHHDQAVGVHLMVGRKDVGTLRPKLHHHRQLVDALVKLHDRVDELAVVAAARIAKVDVALEIGAHVDRPQQRYLRAEYLHLAGEAGVPVHAAADHVYQLDLLLALRLFARVVDVEVEITVLQQQARLDRAELVDGGLIVGQIEHPVQIVLHHVQHHLHVGGCGLQGRDQCAHFAARGARAQALDEWLEQHAGRFARFLLLLAGALLVALFPIHGKSAFAAVATFFLLLFLLPLLLLRRLLRSAWSLVSHFDH